MDYKEMNDYELLYMVSDYSDDLLEIILDKYQPFIHKQIWKWATIFKKLGFNVEDVEQEVYCAVIFAIRNYDESKEASFYTYLTIILDNRMKTIARNFSTQKNMLLNNALSLFSPIYDGTMLLQDVIVDCKNSVETVLEEEMLSREIYRFCYDLPIENAQIFELYWNGYEIGNIANLLECSRTHISNVLYQLRKKIRKYLIDNEFLVV